jgi:hypothetical protein
MKLSQMATIVPLVIVAIGLIGWVLTLRNDVTGTVGQLDGIHEEISAVQGTIDDLNERLIGLEEKLSLADNEMRTIMADHSGFNDVLQDLGKAGLLPSGERRQYGGY